MNDSSVNHRYPNSVDPAEVAHYQALADKWWDQAGPFWPLHTLNRLRVNYLCRWLCQHYQRPADAEQPLAGLRLLDIGCGGGILSESMARLGAQVTGVDVVERNIAVARLHAQQSQLPIDYEAVSVEALAERGQQYDAVLNMEVVEHVADLDSFMSAAHLLVKPNGLHFIATINRNPLAWLTAIVGAEYLLGWLPKGTHHYRKLVKPSELKALLRQEGFALIAQSGVAVNPLTRQMRLTPRLAVNYMLVAQKAGH